MDRAKPFFQFRLRTLFILTAVVGVLCAGVAFWMRAMDLFFEAVLVGYVGPVASADEWPRPLQELLQETSDLELDEGAIKVYCLSDAEEEFIWKMKGPAALFEYVEDKWELVDTEDTVWLTLREVPEWWSPDRESSLSDLLFRRTPVGKPFDVFWVSWDEKKQELFVWYWSNW